MVTMKFLAEEHRTIQNRPTSVKENGNNEVSSRNQPFIPSWIMAVSKRQVTVVWHRVRGTVVFGGKILGIVPRLL
jgi:hypothetical protein